MKTIILTGRLGKKFGTEFILAVETPVEAIRALCYQLEGFEEELAKGAYRVKRIFPSSVEQIDETLLTFKFGRAHTLRIEPTVAGNKSGGLGKIILGIALVGAAFFFSGGALGATAFSAFGSSVSYGQIALIGGLLALSGASAMLAPKVKDKTDDKEEPTSFLISAPQNMIEQGHPVPIVIGECFVGSVMVSAGISVEEYTA
jgi:predicted phage tail protein